MKYKKLFPGEKFELMLVGETAYNFVYCDAHKHIHETVSTLLRTADNKVWICLGVSIILITLIGNTKDVKRGIRVGGSALLITLSALLSPGLSGESRWSRCSYLITLWMFGCIMF